MYKTNILEYLEATVREKPGSSALADSEGELSFFDLSKIAKSIGSYLSQSGFYSEPIAVIAGNNPRSVAAMLGVIYAGCFYTCIDPDLPRERITKILSLLSPHAVIYERWTDALDGISSDIHTVAYDDISDLPINDSALLSVRERHIDTMPAYAVFTSGSTGEPKGVMTSHRALIDYAEALCQAIDFSSDTVFGNQSPLSFDAPMKELLPTLKLGAKTVFIPKKLFSFPVKLCEFLDAKKINTLCWVPSALCMISSLGALDAHKPAYLKLICFGGEVFPMTEYEKWRMAYPEATFVNLYGPTEATGMSCYWIATRKLEIGERIPIGRPFRNTNITLVDECGGEVSGGEGEMYIRGSCLALGYVGGDDGNFVQYPPNRLYKERSYRTGDIARYNERGELVFICRRDLQVKIMGYRIELSEIEAVAYSCVGVRCACAVYLDEKKRLILFVVGNTSEKEVLKLLRSRLPAYMVPDSVLIIDDIPLTQNGKTDRAQLVRKASEW